MEKDRFVNSEEKLNQAQEKLKHGKQLYWSLSKIAPVIVKDVYLSEIEQKNQNLVTGLLAYLDRFKRFEKHVIVFSDPIIGGSVFFYSPLLDHLRVGFGPSKSKPQKWLFENFSKNYFA